MANYGSELGTRETRQRQTNTHLYQGSKTSNGEWVTYEWSPCTELKGNQSSLIPALAGWEWYAMLK